MREAPGAWRILVLNTLAFTVCFACWMVNGVLVTFLVENEVFDWDVAQIGTLIGMPVLTGALMRLPLGILTDKFGGKPVFAALLLFCAVPMFLLSQVHSYLGYVLCSLGFGMVGASFAVGIAFSSVWFSKGRQGTALGIFGAGNAGAALTVMGAPGILKWLTADGVNLEGWREGLFQLCWRQHGGSGLGATLSEALELSTTDRDWLLERIGRQREREAREIEKAGRRR